MRRVSAEASIMSMGRVSPKLYPQIPLLTRISALQSFCDRKQKKTAPPQGPPSWDHIDAYFNVCMMCLVPGR